MQDQTFDAALQAIAAGVDQIVARLESSKFGKSDRQDVLLMALKCAVELARLRQHEAHRRLLRPENNASASSQPTEVDRLRQEFNDRFTQLSTGVEGRILQLQESAASHSHNGVGLYWDLRRRLDALEQQQLSRRFSNDLRAKFEKHYPEYHWADAVERFDRWIMDEKTHYDGPSSAFRKFIKAWLGEPRARWLVNGDNDEAQATAAPE